MSEQQPESQGFLAILRNPKFKLRAPKVDGGRSNPMFGFDVYKGIPSISVFTNHPSDEGKKPIRIGFSLTWFKALVKTVQLVATKYEPGTSRAIACFNGSPNNRQKVGDIDIGKDSNGIMYVGVVVDGYHKQRWPIQGDGYHTIRDSRTGDLIKDSEESCLLAVTYFEMIYEIVFELVGRTYEEPPKQQGGGKGNYGGGNKGSYGGGGGNRGGYNNRDNRGNGNGNGYNNNNNNRPQGGGGGYNQSNDRGGHSFDVEMDDDIPM